MKTKLTLFLSLFCIFNLNAQSSNLSGYIKDASGNPVDFANVVLYNAADSALIKVEYSDDKGAFTFNQIDFGTYYFEIKFLGYKDYQSEVIELTSNDAHNLGVITLDTQEQTIEGVVVTAKKPLLEMKPDKVVLNVEGSINASGSDAFTLLRQSPGVVIDNNDNIFMLGKSGLQIYIDGKPSQLAGSDLAEYLKTIPSSEIVAIEIITNPSSKYDAEGNAGIINIKLRRDKSLGSKTTINSSFSIGQRARTNTTVRSTYKAKKWNVFGSVSAYRGEDIDPFNLYREQSGLIFDQTNVGEGGWKGINYRTGMDFLVSEKSTFGILFNGSTRTGTWDQNSRSDISTVGNSYIDSSLIASANSTWDKGDWNINTNYKYDNKDGFSLNLDLDYGTYNRDDIETQPNEYVDPDGNSLAIIEYRSETPNKIDIATAKIDIEKNLGSATFSAGLKYSDVTTDNMFGFYQLVDDIPVLDIEQSNDFKYIERVSAAYVNYGAQYNSFGIQAGLRVEHTESNGILTALIPSNNEEVNRSYTDLFPSFGMTFQLNQKNTFQLNYSRRLNRPNYQDLNPFRSRLDELTFEQGNPFLNPEYAQSIQLSHSWNYKLNTSISYSRTTDLITRITDTTEVTSAYITWLNLAEQEAYSINVSAPIPITDWWNTYTSLTGVHTHNKSDFGEGKRIDLSATTFNVYAQHSFQLPKGIGMEISGWYNSPSIWGGTFEMDPIWSLNFGLQKKFMEDKLTVRMGVDDIFLSTRFKGTSVFGDLNLKVDGRNDSRRFKINVAYSFGNQNVKARKRDTGLEDEKNRIN
ncbi:MAG: TonB-dependent receptor [Saprospiraceae bacterium]|nr:TonB-dependent receptor [Saprospiraceae bacterium]